MKKLINKMATPMFSKITMATRMGAEPWKRREREEVSPRPGLERSLSLGIPHPHRPARGQTGRSLSVGG